MDKRNKSISIEDVLHGYLGGFVNGEHNISEENACNINCMVEVPNLRIIISGQYYRQTTAEECSTILSLLNAKTGEINQAIMAIFSDQEIRIAVTAIQTLLNLRRINNE